MPIRWADIAAGVALGACAYYFANDIAAAIYTIGLWLGAV